MVSTPLRTRTTSEQLVSFTCTCCYNLPFFVETCDGVLAMEVCNRSQCGGTRSDQALNECGRGCNRLVVTVRANPVPHESLSKYNELLDITAEIVSSIILSIRISRRGATASGRPLYRRMLTGVIGYMIRPTFGFQWHLTFCYTRIKLQWFLQRSTNFSNTDGACSRVGIQTPLIPLSH